MRKPSLVLIRGGADRRPDHQSARRARLQEAARRDMFYAALTSWVFDRVTSGAGRRRARGRASSAKGRAG